jgi:hypothetical protein
MLNALKEKLEYKHDGLYWRNGQCAGKRAGSLRPDGYRNITVNLDGKRKSYLEHRLCFYYMTGKWPSEIDHVNRIKDDNSWTNIRECTRAENNWNKISGKNIRKSCQKYTVEIQRNGVYKYLGRFDTYEQALNARLQEENLYR